MAAAAAAALRYCFANTVLGGWLVLSVWILPTQNEATAINHFMVGAAMFIASLIPAARSPVPAL